MAGTTSDHGFLERTGWSREFVRPGAFELGRGDEDMAYSGASSEMALQTTLVLSRKSLFNPKINCQHPR